MAIKSAQKPAFKLMNATLPLFVLHLQVADATAVVAGVRSRFAGDPEFFQHTPVVLSLSALSADVLPDFTALCNGLREIGMRPIGIMDASDAQIDAALACGLARFEDRVAKAKTVSEAVPEAASTDAAEPAPPGQVELVLDAAPVTTEFLPDLAAPSAKVGGGGTAPGQGSAMTSPVETRATATPIQAAAPGVFATADSRRPPLVIDKPVRTGQRIHAEGRDLIVLAMVSAGAELIADGDIHVYAPLRGRALAGARGDTSARIYAQCMGAELVSIAGNFKVLEDVPPMLKGKPAQVRLDGERVVMSALGD